MNSNPEGLLFRNLRQCSIKALIFIGGALAEPSILAGIAIGGCCYAGKIVFESQDFGVQHLDLLVRDHLGGGGDEPPPIDPIIAGLLKRLPKSGDVWPEAERKLWLQLLEGSFKLIYKDQTPAPSPKPLPPPPN